VADDNSECLDADGNVDVNIECVNPFADEVWEAEDCCNKTPCTSSDESCEAPAEW